MLVLTRRDHETIRIGRSGEILVKVIRSEDGHVRLGIEAPANIPIDREEIFYIKQAKLLAKEQEENKKNDSEVEKE